MLGCDMEDCPFCAGQLISCDCMYKRFYADTYEPQKWNYERKCFEGHPTNGLPLGVYNNGAPESMVKEWEEILEDEGRVPFIEYPLMCGYCGALWPAFFKVSDEEWNRYVQKSKRGSILCKKCYAKIKKMVDKGGSI